MWRQYLITFSFILSLGLRTASGETAVEECPEGCACYHGFTTVKCRDSPLRDLPRFDKKSMARVVVLDMTGCRVEELREAMLSHYPKLKRLILKNNGIKTIERRALESAPALQDLDLRGNKLKSLPSGMFSNSKLRVLYLENNPFSCDPSTVRILHEEVKTLMSEDTNLEMFDGGRLVCADPPNMKGQKILYLPDKAIRASYIMGGATKMHVGYSGMVLAAVAMVACLLTALVATAFILFKKIISLKKDKVSIMEEGESLIDLTTHTEHSETSQTEDTLTSNLHKLRRKSQGYPEGDIIASDDEDAVDPEMYIKDKMEKQRRHSLGYPRGESSSDDGMEDINLYSSG